MKKVIIIGVVLAFMACSENNSGLGTADLTTKQDSISYSIGMDIGAGMRSQFVEVDPENLYHGFVAAYNDEDGLIPEETRQEILMKFQNELRTIQAEKRQSLISTNLVAAEEFLKANSEKDDVVVLESGLQYKVITLGDGPVPTKSDRVKVHYRGTLLSGKEFDSSYKRGEPATFATTQVIKGWTEALQLMPVGSKWELFIHPTLGYGDRGSRNIEPNSALIFEVELLEIVK